VNSDSKSNSDTLYSVYDRWGRAYMASFKNYEDKDTLSVEVRDWLAEFFEGVDENTDPEYAMRRCFLRIDKHDQPILPGGDRDE
jgi:hypothetical protein